MRRGTPGRTSTLCMPVPLSWQYIGDALGIKRHTAFERYAKPSDSDQKVSA